MAACNLLMRERESGRDREEEGKGREEKVREMKMQRERRALVLLIPTAACSSMKTIRRLVRTRQQTNR